MHSKLGHPKYLIIFNYGIGIKTGIHFQLRNWLRNWEFGPKVAKISKFLLNSWQAWICEMLWCHFFHFNAKCKPFNNRILKRKKFWKYTFLKMLKSPNFWPKVVNFRAQKITELTNSELRNRYWNSITELRNSVSELDALVVYLWNWFFVL